VSRPVVTLDCALCVLVQAAKRLRGSDTKTNFNEDGKLIPMVAKASTVAPHRQRSSSVAGSSPMRGKPQGQQRQKQQAIIVQQVPTLTLPRAPMRRAPQPMESIGRAAGGGGGDGARASFGGENTLPSGLSLLSASYLQSSLVGSEELAAAAAVSTLASRGAGKPATSVSSHSKQALDHFFAVERFEMYERFRTEAQASHAGRCRVSILSGLR
jgi:hypothetical protein